MITSNVSPEVTQLYTLLQEYSFDVDAYPIDVVIQGWLKEFELIWVNHAITEALYQGRYKIVSVEHILKLWQRRGHPIRHFNREFESIILGQSLLCYPDPPKSEESRTLLPSTAVANQPTGSESIAERIDGFPPPSQNSPDGFSDQGSWHREEQSQIGISIDLTHDEPDYRPDDLAVWFNSELPVPNFQAVNVQRPIEAYHSEPIQPFVPRREASAMHQRLKAVVQGGSRS